MMGTCSVVVLVYCCSVCKKTEAEHIEVEAGSGKFVCGRGRDGCPF